MPDRMSDSEVLEQTAEWLGRLADTIEKVTERLGDFIATIHAEQERQADEIRALSNRIEAVSRSVSDEHRPLHLGRTGPDARKP